MCWGKSIKNRICTSPTGARVGVGSHDIHPLFLFKILFKKIDALRLNVLMIFYRNLLFRGFWRWPIQKLCRNDTKKCLSDTFTWVSLGTILCPSDFLAAKVGSLTLDPKPSRNIWNILIYMFIEPRWMLMTDRSLCLK